MVMLVIWPATPSKFRLNCTSQSGVGHELHQFLPRDVVRRLAVQGVEQKRRLRLGRMRGASENDESKRKA